MNNVQSARLAMYLATQRELQAISNAVGIAGLIPLLDVFDAKVEEVYSLHQIQTDLTPPKTTTRNQVLDAMVDIAVAVAGPLGAHAHQQGLHEAEAVADVTAHSFRELRLVERPTLAQKIHDAALPLLVALTPFGLTEQMLTELQAKIDAARGILNEPRTTIISRREATKDLAELFVAIDLLLEKQIDRVLAPLRLSHADLHGRYLAARQVRRRGRSEGEEPAIAPVANSATVVLAAPQPAQHAAA